MTNYLDEYNKRMTYGNAMGFNPSPLAQTAHMHADRDRQIQQGAGGVHSGAPVGGITFGNKDGDAGLGRALLILGGGVALLVVSVMMIESRHDVLSVIGMVGAFIGFVLSAFGAVATFLTGLMTIGFLIRQKIFWGIVGVSGLCAYALSIGAAFNVFVVLMIGWGTAVHGKKLIRRFSPASKTDSQ